MASAVTPAEQRKKGLYTPKEFKEKLERHVKIQKHLDKLHAEALKNKGELKSKAKGRNTKYNGEERTLSLLDIKAKKTKNLGFLLKLKTPYRRTWTRVPMDRIPSANGGLRQPLAISGELLNFLRVADFGPADGNGGRGKLMRTFLEEKSILPRDPNAGPVASGAILTSLLVLYAKKWNLTANAAENQRMVRAGRGDLVNGQLLGADNVMKQYLPNTLAVIQQQSLAKLAEQGLRDGQEKPALTKRGRARKYTNPKTGAVIWTDFEHAFNPDNFSYGNLQSIYRSNGNTFKMNGSEEVDANGQPVNVTAVNPATQENELVNALVKPDVLAKLYMINILAAGEKEPTEAGALGTFGNTYADIAKRTADNFPGLTPEQTRNLALRALLDEVHDVVSNASGTYVTA